MTGLLLWYLIIAGIVALIGYVFAACGLVMNAWNEDGAGGEWMDYGVITVALGLAWPIALVYGLVVLVRIGYDLWRVEPVLTDMKENGDG